MTAINDTVTTLEHDMISVIVFGPTGQVGSVAARTAAEHGVRVWLAMRDTSKEIPGLTKDVETRGGSRRVRADLQDPDTVSQAVQTAGATRAFLHRVPGASDHLQGAIEAMKAAGIKFVVFLSSFTIPTTTGLRDIPASDIIPYVHAQVEAHLDEILGVEHYVAVRPGCFITNLLRERRGIAEGHVTLYGGTFEHDNITPSDIGAACGHILVSGPRHGQQKVYLYGPQILSIHDCIVNIGKTLGKDIQVTTLGAKEAYDNYIRSGMPEASAKYMVEALSTKGPDKGHGERFPQYEEGVNNVQLYTGKPSTSLELFN